MDWLTLAGILGQLGVSAYGAVKGAERDAENEKLLRDALSEFGGLEVPELAAIAPEELGPSAYGAIRTDPALASAQREVLARLGALSNEGLTASDEAMLAELGLSAAQQAQAQRAAIDDRLAQRGLLGSGAALAAQTQASQAAAERAAQAGRDRSAMALDRRMDALGALGSYASSLRGQDYNEKARSAEAKDAIARYNAAARTGAAQYNASLPGEQFRMNLSKLAGKSGQSGALGGLMANRGQSEREFWGGLGGALYQGTQALRTDRPAYRNPYAWYDDYGTPRPPRRGT